MNKQKALCGDTPAKRFLQQITVGTPQWTEKGNTVGTRSKNYQSEVPCLNEGYLDTPEMTFGKGLRWQIREFQ